MRALALARRGPRRATDILPRRLMRHSAGRVGTVIVLLFTARIVPQAGRSRVPRHQLLA